MIPKNIHKIFIPPPPPKKKKKKKKKKKHFSEKLKKYRWTQNFEPPKMTLDYVLYRDSLFV